MFDRRWETWFAKLDIPKDEGIKKVVNRARRVIGEVHTLAAYADEEQEKAADDACTAVEKEISGDVEEVIDTLNDCREIIAAADAQINDLQDALTVFLNRFQAVYMKDVNDGRGEVGEWIDTNVKGDYEWLNIEGFDVLVLFEENDRLFFKMRFG